ncbi:MAG: hypothetical protein ABFD98_18575 [Syntrophobacteraceae bacterium]|nr:hypothetical protein [Desulfobacteraceae bacterium]
MNPSEKRSTWLFEVPEEGAAAEPAGKLRDRVDVSPMGTEGCLWWDWDFSFCDPEEPFEEGRE